MKRAPSLEAFLSIARSTSTAVAGSSATAKALGPVRILGVDPGSRVTGWGVVDLIGARRVHVASGCIRCTTGTLPERLRRVLDELSTVIECRRPIEAAIEQVFVRKNIGSALILGQARGAALCALAGADLRIAEYAPAQVKSAIVGSGRAEKAQVQFMVGQLLGIRGVIQPDEADALAIALCHSQMRRVCAVSIEVL